MVFAYLVIGTGVRSTGVRVMVENNAGMDLSSDAFKLDR